jgi:hypothetical protein
VAGDMLSDIEIPILDTLADDPLGDYRTGLERLASVRGVRRVVPGHGHVADAGEFRRRLDADTRYLDLLAVGEPFDDPRCTVKWQRDWHEHQLRECRPTSGLPPWAAAGPGTARPPEDSRLSLRDQGRPGPVMHPQGSCLRPHPAAARAEVMPAGRP